jgi:hypothetical protein
MLEHNSKKTEAEVQELIKEKIERIAEKVEKEHGQPESLTDQ